MGKLKLHYVNVKFEDLDEASQNKILGVEEVKVQQQIDKEEAMLQEIFIKLACLILNDMGLGDRMYEFLCSFQPKYFAFQQIAEPTDDNGMAKLDEMIRKVYPDFPQEFIEQLKRR